MKKNKNNRRYLASLVSILAWLPAGIVLAQPIDEPDLLDKNTVRTERAIHSSKLALWTLPFETTQFVPNAPTPEMQAAMAAQQSGRYLEAIDLLEKSKDPSTDLQLLRASYYLQGDQPRLAEDILAAVLKTSPGLAEAQALMAMSYLQRGKLEAAGQTASAALASGNSPLTARVASYALQAQGMLAEASALMAKESANGAANALNLAREAELALSLGDVPRAQPLVARAREIAPDSPYVMAVSGLVWLISDQPAKAQHAFEIALKRDPEDPKALLGLGLAEARQGRLEPSITHLRKAADSDPSSAAIQTYLGRALQQAGHEGGARKAFETAIKLDPNDPAPRIYLAQLLNESGQPAAALQGLRQAEKLKTSRSAYRGENLLNEDAQTIQSNLAMVYRKLGLSELAWQTLAGGAGDKNAQTLKNQAEILQGLRFAENARRSLALQSLFNDDLDALPVTLDIYGDGAGQTGSQTPQHGPIGGLSGQQASYGDYGALFATRAHVEADGIVASNQSWGEQVRTAVGGNQFGISVAQRHYETDGFTGLDNLDNTVWQGVLKWHPTDSTKLFLSYQNFKSERGEIFYPGFFDDVTQIKDQSWTARLGLSQRLGNGELRVLLSHQDADQNVDYVDYGFAQPANTKADGGEMQYLQTNSLGHFTAGFQAYREKAEFLGVSVVDIHAHQLYLSQLARLSDNWTMNFGLGHAWQEIKTNFTGDFYNTELRRWTPRFGLAFTPVPETRVRLALGQHLGLREVGGASLAPAETTGFINTRPSDADSLVRSAGLGFDHRLGRDWLFNAEVHKRKYWAPLGGSADPDDQELAEFRQLDGQLRLDWMPANQPVSLGFAATYEKRENRSGFLPLDAIHQQRLRDVSIRANWFVNSRLSARVEVSRNWVEGQREDWVVPPYPSYKDASTQINASLRWKLQNGLIELGVRNLLDDDFEYSESDPLNPRFSPGRFVYGTARLSW